MQRFEKMVGFLWRFLRVLWVCRVATLSAVGGGLLIAKLEQARDLFADTGLAWHNWLAFFLLLFLWAWLVHGMGRRALQFDEWVPEAHRPGGLSQDDRDRLGEEYRWLAIWIPRGLGFVVFAATAWALVLTRKNLSTAMGLKQAEDAVSLTSRLLVVTLVLTAGYLGLVYYWRGLRARFRDKPREAPLLTGTDSVLVLGCRALWDWKKNGPALLEIISSPLNRTLIGAAVVVTAVFVFALWAPDAVSDRFPRVIFLPMLLGGGVLLFGEIASLSHRYTTPLLVCFFIFGAFLGYWLVHYNDVRWIRSAADPAVATPIRGTQHQLNLADAIERWRVDNECPAPKECPRPIVIAGAGGASRAGFFTASVVGAMIDAGDKDKDLGNIRKRIFALSTVSGSSVGAVMMRAAWMDALENKSPDKPPCREGGTDAWFRGYAPPPSGKADAPANTSWRDCFQQLLAGDFLSPVFVGLTYRDIFPLGNVITGEGFGEDRSGLLEQSFERWYRERTKAEAAACGSGERTGLCRQLGHLPDRSDPSQPGDWIPLLFVNGTSVATGRRIIASDVRIGCILDGDRRFLEFAYDYRELRDPSVRKDHEKCSEALPDPDGQDIDMRLSTVALMSARFPVISTQGVIRDVDGTIVDSVVDGGYFENDGLATAADIVRELQEKKLHPIVIRIVNEPDPKVDKVSDSTATAKDQQQYETRKLSGVVHRDGEDELVRPPLPKAEERTLFDVYTSIGRALYATRSGHEDGHLAYLRETLKGPLVRIGVGGIAVPEPPRPRSAKFEAARKLFCRSLVTKTASMEFVSMSWWMSQPVQAYLDAQLCRPQVERLMCVLKLKGNDVDDKSCD